MDDKNISVIDEYIFKFPEDVQKILRKLRQVIKEAAPEAEEKISYQMPTFYLNGNLVHFAAYENHIGFYPAPSGIEEFKKELAKYKGAKGSVRFPLNEALPFELIRKIVEFRVAENKKKQTGDKSNKISKKYLTPEDYIEKQPTERQAALENLRQTIKGHLPNGFQETIQFGMIGYVVPHSIYPNGYHVNPKEPLPYIALANQKGYIALYHLAIYADESLLDWFVKSYEELNIGKLDMGKSCIRFKKIDQIPYNLIGELCSKLSVEEYISLYESNKPV